MHVEFPHHHRPRLFQGLDHRRVFSRHVIDDLRSTGGRHSAHVEHILHGYGDTVQRAAAHVLFTFPISLSRAVQGGLRKKSDEGMQRRVHVVDAINGRFGEIHRRELAFVEG